MKSFNSLISVFEHQTLRLADFATYPNAEQDFAWLLEQIQTGNLPCFSIGYAGQVVIQVRHYLAVIRLPTGMLLEVLPKISKQSASPLKNDQQLTRQWVSQMLADIYGVQTQPLSALSTAQKQRDSTPNQHLESWLLPLIQAWYGLLSQLPSLLPRHYQQAIQNNPQAQGKLLIKEQMSHNAHRPHYRFTRQQQLDLHPLWGQFFITAVQKVQSLAMTVPNEVVPAVQSIASVHTPLPVSQWQSSYYQLKQLLATSRAQGDEHGRKQLELAVELAWLMLQMQETTATPVYGNEIVPVVMINMQQAFERWVSGKLSEQSLGKVVPQARCAWLQMAEDERKPIVKTDEHINVDNQSMRYLQPDVLIYDEQGKVVTVADVKYKQISDISQVSTSDLYQLYTYQQYFESEQAWLIYPTMVFPLAILSADEASKSVQIKTQAKTLQKSQSLQLMKSSKHNDENLQQIKVIPFDVLTGKLLLEK